MCFLLILQYLWMLSMDEPLKEMHELSEKIKRNYRLLSLLKDKEYCKGKPFYLYLS